jgi:hypothetical protein
MLTWPIHLYRAELSYLILLLIGLLLTRHYTVLLGRITLPDLFPIRLQSTRPYTILPGRITLPDHFPIGLLPTRLYPATLPDFLTRSSNTSLHPTAYPALPNHLTRLGTLQLASPEDLLIGLPP